MTPSIQLESVPHDPRTGTCSAFAARARAIVNAMAAHQDVVAAEAAMRQYLAHSAEALRQSSKSGTI